MPARGFNFYVNGDIRYANNNKHFLDLITYQMDIQIILYHIFMLMSLLW